MQTLFLILTIFTGVAEGAFLLAGYLRAQKGECSPKWIQTGKLTLFCAFFALWFLWNFFRAVP